ncbi:hypothetical protein OCH239_04085 [Roseivivax halodurans JCM 10272]|uniref:SPW repeat-containing protein n=1 Tax=Roseivivax halodurans JCM 10272 TaxID=1449350 RepID=X7EDZ4_9RHOB|nr:hypothetical protein [Roseivivax halodurans]ETX14309.1 hypothetical protein OCH239_04085 [Roseivivax halodurans JCM 10272]
MSTLVPTGKRAVTVALVFGVLAAILPFMVSLSPEKAVAAHLIGLTIAAIAAKAIQWPGRGDGLLLASVGALAIVIPVFAWQMPAGGAWGLLLLGAMTAAIGLRLAFRNGETQSPADTAH